VLHWIERAGQAAALSPAGDNRALSAMAATVVASKRDIPHFYATADLAMAHAAAWRAGWNEKHPDLHATYNDVFVLCAARSLRDSPRLNVSYSNGSYKQHSAADVVLVVAHEPTMLLAPLADPCALSWQAFLQTVRRATQLNTPTAAEPLLAISNLGMFRVKQFAAIIPPSCTSALAIGAVREQPTIKNGKLENELVCSITISADHRVVDGVAVARFLERVQFHLNSL
jgi:pyruvate dehydrogenase E2 component (dihydrolipoamide acetyltransferase)